MNPDDPSITRYPTPIRLKAFETPADERKQLIEQKIHEIMDILGLDLSHPSIKKTPFRISKMFVDEIFSGLNPAHFPSITLHEQKVPQSEVVLVKNISFVSFCEHHFVPMIGKAHVAYIPKDKIIGLSKVNRIVHFFSKQPQVQERLTAQIADCLSLLLNIEDVAVFMKAKHFCVAARGVEDDESETETCVLKGKFQNDSLLRAEFMQSIHSPSKE